MASITRFHVGPRLSETAVHNGTVYLAGQVPDDTTQDIRGQTTQVLGMVDRLLAEAGSDKSLHPHDADLPGRHHRHHGQ
jgi:enamine deaminase RidA (YjgF/YER057c/UK114 family)